MAKIYPKRPPPPLRRCTLMTHKTTCSLDLSAAFARPRAQKCRIHLLDTLIIPTPVGQNHGSGQSDMLLPFGRGGTQ